MELAFEPRMLIDGALVEAQGARTDDNVNPATESGIGPVADGSTAGRVGLKPAPDTPYAPTWIGRLAAEETDIPAGVLNVVTASDPAAVGDVLSGSPLVDMISFTGSTAVGKHIAARAADTLKRVFLELGGKSANIVLDDANFAE